MSLRIEDIACFGQFHLQQDRWSGRQLVPAAWVDETTSLQTADGSDPAGNWDQGYGYQFWRCPHSCYRGDGASGQFCVVMPDADAVLAVTAGTNELGPECDLTLRLRFFGDKIAVDLEQDLSFGESTPAHLLGKVSSPAKTQ